MAGTFQFELVSPSRLVMSGEVEEVVVPGTEGDFGVLAGHAPFMSTLRPGFIEVRRAEGTDRIFVRGGFADTNPTGLTILAEEAVPADELTAETIDHAIEIAEAALENTHNEVKAASAALRVSQLQEIRAGL